LSPPGSPPPKGTPDPGWVGIGRTPSPRGGGLKISLIRFSPRLCHYSPQLKRAQETVASQAEQLALAPVLRCHQKARVDPPTERLASVYGIIWGVVIRILSEGLREGWGGEPRGETQIPEFGWHARFSVGGREGWGFVAKPVCGLYLHAFQTRCELQPLGFEKP